MSNCPLCRRPQWDGTESSSATTRPGFCGASMSGPVSASTAAAMYYDCRSHALSVAALVAPVVEAGIAWDQTNNLGDQRALHEAVEQMCAGLRDRDGGS